MTATDDAEGGADDAGGADATDDAGGAGAAADAGGIGETAPDGAADPRELLRELVAIPSPTGEERACAERLVSYLEANGREAWLDAAGNVRAPGDDAVLLTSHVDTVPGDLDVELAPGADGDPALWGRGSVDAKGSLAAMAVVAVRTGASFVGVVGEEVDSRGARHLVAERDAPDAAINGEPSGWDAITLGYRGLLAGRYGASGPRGHSSRPEPNPLQDAMAWWGRVEDAFGTGEGADDGTERRGEHGEGPVFERVTPKPTSMEGGPTDDGRAVGATVEFGLRIPPGTDPDAVRTTVEGLAGSGSVRWHDDRAVPPVMESPRTPLARAFRAAIREGGGEPRMLRKTGTADVNHYAAAWDCPTVTYGPGDAALDHAPDEHLPLAEFDRAVDVLETAVERFTRP